MYFTFDVLWMAGYFLFNYPIFIVPRGGIGPEGIVLVFVVFLRITAPVIETNSKVKWTWSPT